MSSSSSNSQFEIWATLAQLKSVKTGVQGWVAKQLLRLIVPLARAAVGEREHGKSIAVKVHNISNEIVCLGDSLSAVAYTDIL